MKKFLLAHHAGESAESTLTECLKQLSEIPPEANFGFLYLSDHLHEQAAHILAELKDATQISNWVGSTGIGLIASQQEYYNQPAIVIMLADFNEADFHILPNFIKNTSGLRGKLTEWCQRNDFNIGLIHADPENALIQPLLHQLGKDIPGAFLIGGVTSSRAQNIQFANSVQHGGISGVLFSQQITILSNLTQGCSPIGTRHRVTDCDQNIAFTLDNKPALDVLADDTGEIIARDWEQAANFIFAGLVNKNSDTDDYTIRQLAGVDQENKLIVINDHLENGQDIIFCRRDSNSAIDDMQRMLLQLKARTRHPIKGGIYISCMGRGRNQFGANSEEVRLIHSVLGDFPLAGFFANGEIHKSMLYGFTGVLTLFI
ncbi:MAG TPA: histidine kinase [Gammaproteobacteria bacterium]|nr:histidine kinase [Gammaproteobacteria bacterium]